MNVRDHETPLEVSIRQLHQKVKPLKQPHAKYHREAMRTLSNSQAKNLTGFLSPLWTTSQEQKISQLVVLVHKEASKQNIPLVGDFDYSATGKINAKFMHYDRLLDLSLPEVMFLEQIVRVVAKRHNIQILPAGVLRFEVLWPENKPASATQQAETEQSVQRYLEMCRPHDDLWRPFDEVVHEALNLGYPVRCSCGTS